MEGPDQAEIHGCQEVRSHNLGLELVTQSWGEAAGLRGIEDRHSPVLEELVAGKGLAQWDAGGIAGVQVECFD